MLGQCLSQNEEIGQELGLGFSRVGGSSLPGLEDLKPEGDVGEERDGELWRNRDCVSAAIGKLDNKQPPTEEF